MKELIMMKTRLSLIAAVAMLALTAGCGKKAPKQLPPPPMSGSEVPGGNGGAGGTRADAGTVGQTGLGGARADFVRAAGSGRIFFGTDEYGIDDEDRRTLDAQAAWLVAHPAISVTIEGH